jgi:hypothetical protein
MWVPRNQPATREIEAQPLIPALHRRDTFPLEKQLLLLPTLRRCDMIPRERIYYEVIFSAH